jgi:hypothetical protein
MKKLLGILVLGFVFVLTTAGLFKSALEECTDALLPMSYIVVVGSEWKTVEMTDSEKLIARKKWEKAKKKYESNKRDIGFFIDYDSLEYPPTKKSVKIRDIPKSESLRKYNKFLKQSLKKKLKNGSYEKQYKNCIYQKKKNPELFDAKYD